MNNKPFPLKIANSLELDFKAGNSVYSNNYHDIYFQPVIGLEEKRHVFLAGNNLPNSWQGRDNFTIAETGFGTGLNFLASMQLWDNSYQKKQHLHYISCELHPLNTKQLQQVLSNFPELNKYTQLLLNNYPTHLFYGFHRIHFTEVNVTLTLIIADCVDAFEQLTANIDAWYLDGFAPSKNNQMWSKELFKVIANLSHIGTTVATYTVAGAIRDNLSGVGFAIKKTQGFGQKREMLRATMVATQTTSNKQPWQQTFKATKHENITILGAGIAGVCLADKFTKLGKNVTLIDRQEYPCLETSGNPQAMVMPHFTLNDSIQAQFYLSAFLYAINYYPPQSYHAIGVHELAFTEPQQLWQEKLLHKFEFPQDLVRKHLNGILYASAGWLDTQSNAQTVFAKLNHYLSAEITQINYHNNLWHLSTQQKVIHTTDVLVLANGININKILPDYHLPISPKHGQISYFNSADINKQIAKCPHIQLNQGYITPSWHGVQTIGATYDHIKAENWYKPVQTSSDHWQRNCELWKNTPYADFLQSSTSHKARAGIRVTSKDHLPVCGAVIDQSQFAQDYHDVRHGKYWQQYPIPHPLENLYIFTGLGSRGFTSAPLLAEFLCNQILGTPQALDAKLQQAINPNRFLFKQLKRL